MNDGAPGALLPSLEISYSLNYAVVSLIFLSNAVGFIFSSFLSNKLHILVGRCKSLIIGTILQALCYVILSTRPPYEVVVLAFFLAGAGMGFILAHSNSYMVWSSIYQLTEGNSSECSQSVGIYAFMLRHVSSSHH